MVLSASASAWKRKARKHLPRQEGGSAGVALPLQLLQSSSYQSVYTIPVIVGSSRQNFSLQVDTGSSDLWIASKSCSSSACSSTDGHLYDPSSSAIPTNQTFSITYAEGAVSGPIVWDSIDFGGYNISNQALAAANSVSKEPLTSAFSGILGLALPLDSVIAYTIPPADGDSADGSPLTSNLFSMLPSSSAPSEPFFSLSLERPGSTEVPSILGIGHHPTEVVSDPEKVQYAPVLSEREGAVFWEASISAITVWVNGKPNAIPIPPSGSGTATPSAVLDSGTPVILASPTIANAIYGAIGISPASDGSYSVPCTTPINMTITLDNRSPIPLHPLDLTYLPNSDSTMCPGMIQNSEVIGSSYVYLPDLILGVPFLRNTYTVMAYEPPGSNGVFSASDTVQSADDQISPSLGLLALTNITKALQEFNTVRVMNEPLDPTVQGSTNPAPSPKHLSAGIDVLIACLGFLCLCGIIFAARWAYMRRKYRRSPSMEDRSKRTDLPDVSYILARRVSTTDRYSQSDDTLRLRSWDRKHRGDVPSQYSTDTMLTRVNDASDLAVDFDLGHAKQGSIDDSSVMSWGRDSIFAREQRYSRANRGSDSQPGTPPDSPGFMSNSREEPRGSLDAQNHDRQSSEDLGVAVPLLVHTRSDSSVSRLEDVGDAAFGQRGSPSIYLQRPPSSASRITVARGRSDGQ